MAAHGSRSEAQQVAEFGCADGTMLQHRVQDAVTRALFGVVGVAAAGGGNSVRNGRHVCPGGPGARSAAPGWGRGRRGAHGIHNTIMS